MIRSTIISCFFAALSLQLLAADPATTPAPAPALPPQWDRALPVTVVVGADVAVGVDSQFAPSPLLLRVDDPKRLRDAGSKAAECVIDAEASGNLASERVIVRLAALRCFDADGSQIVAKPIRGYAVDKDARAGVKATVGWSQPAKDLVMLGVGTQAKQNFLAKGIGSALSKATLGLGDSLFREEDKPGISGDVIRELRTADTLLPVLMVEPSRMFRLVVLGM